MGDKIVMATGVFDILHPGHLYFLTKAKKLGDRLIVVVARDSTATKLKHPPIIPQEARVMMVSALKPVDKALLGYEDDMFRIVEEVNPDIIVLGFDQMWDEKELQKEIEHRGVKTKILRLGKDTSDIAGTRKIIEKVVDRYLKNSLYGGEKK